MLRFSGGHTSPTVVGFLLKSLAVADSSAVMSGELDPLLLLTAALPLPESLPLLERIPAASEDGAGELLPGREPSLESELMENLLVDDLPKPVESSVSRLFGSKCSSSSRPISWCCRSAWWLLPSSSGRLLWPWAGFFLFLGFRILDWKLSRCCPAALL